MGSLHSCSDELQQQAYAQRLELEDAHHGYIESRREQVRLQEKPVARARSIIHEGKSASKTQIRNFQEMGEMKRSQELRVDEFSSNPLFSSP